MPSNVEITTNGDPVLTDRDYARLTELVEKHTKIVLGREKREMVSLRFGKRLRSLGLETFKQYCDLAEDPESRETESLISAITTNFTNFFREDHHFDFLVDHILEKVKNKRLRIWSAGCSTGEEPYTIAMTLRERIPNIDSWNVKILATDIDEKVLATAASGVYPESRIDTIPEEQRNKWLRKGTDGNAGKVIVAPEIRKMIVFKQLNLEHAWPMKGPFDIIFCRNVVIYFGSEFKEVLFDRYADLQEVGAPLIIGHSENISGVTDRYKTIGRTIYEKVA